MSVTANDKGAVEQRVNLVKRGSGEIQHVMLNSALIKKAENYGLMTDRFITNNLPAVLQRDVVLMTFYPKRADIQPRDGFQVGRPVEQYLKLRSEFQPNKLFSIARFCEALSLFVKDFNYALNMQGAIYSPQDFGLPNPNPLYYVPQHAIWQAKYANAASHQPYDAGNYVDVEGQDFKTYVSLGFNSDGNIQLNMTSHFLSNFYIELDPVFARLVGLPRLIYAEHEQVDIVMSNSPDVQPLFYDAGGVPGFNVDPEIAEDRSILSTKSVFQIDERLSLDLEISLPLSQSIDVHNGSEKHTYLLNRYMITDYVTVECRTQQSGNKILTKSIIEDQLNTGFADLVKNQPSSHTTQLLNGAIQELDLRLVLRYKQYKTEAVHGAALLQSFFVTPLALPTGVLDFTVERKTYSMDDYGSMYDLLLLFNKKV